MNDIGISSGIVVNTASVTFQGVWDSNTASNWSSLMDFLHHLFFSRDLTVLVGVVDLVAVWGVAGAGVWGTVHALDH